MEDISWKIIDIMFKNNKNLLIKHHIDSYNDFFSKGIINIYKSLNPFNFFKEQIPNTNKYQYSCKLYFGGKNGDKIYYGKPIVIDKEKGKTKEQYMYPNIARLRNMTYGFTIHYDIDIEYTIYVDNGSGRPGLEGYDVNLIQETIDRVYLGRFPIMIQSNLCILKNLSPETRFNLGECRNDNGGYFIIDGKEKAIVSQEGRADNMFYIKNDFSDFYNCSAEIRSVSEDASKPVRTLAVRMVREQSKARNGNIVVNVPNVRKPVPLFILMRALGVISDKEIIQHCLLDMDKYNDLIELFRPSIHDAGYIFTQEAALHYIKTLTKGYTISHVFDILMNYFLPHMGEHNFKAKALYIGYMVKRMLLVHIDIEKDTDRDSYRYKRLEHSGMLIYGLFREYFKKQSDNIYLKIDKKYYYNNNYVNYQGVDFVNLIKHNKHEFFSERIVEIGFRKAFKGNWGADEHTKRMGVVQEFSRLSFFSSLCQLRKTNLPIAADGAKIIAPRRLNATQYGYLCPIHSPDGGNVGLHKHLSISTHITSGTSIIPFIVYLQKLKIKLLEECSINYLSKTTKIFLNGRWIGATSNPQEIISIVKLHRRNKLIDIYTSIFFDIKRNEISICTDAGRITRPLFYNFNGIMSFERDTIMEKLEKNTLTWSDIIYGLKPSTENILNKDSSINLTEKVIKDLINNSSVVEYIDPQEGENMMLAHSQLVRERYEEKNITHSEIHPSLILSVMANQSIFAANNPYPRNAFSCGQGKQAVSLFHTNYSFRIDKSSFLLNYGQIPMTSSKYFKYITNNEHPYGENAIVAIMSYTGYNVEDAVIINEGALKRGLFRTTYYNSYEAHEEMENIGGAKSNTLFLNPQKNKNVKVIKEGFDYNKLDENGIIRENEIVDEKTIMMGLATSNKDSDYIDSSVTPKKGQTGIVDKAFLSKTEEGKRIGKVRIRAQRIPDIGDKFCSRAGQKGTVGIILKEQDMPTTSSGIRPDIIVNPHAMPSRMTIGHLVETITSKVGCLYGAFSDCTAFQSNGPKHRILGEMLMKQGYHASGNEILYNGFTGEQLEADIYFGPTYYERLKHMPKDKINYRARGPRQALTRQTVQGRANNGGLRIGEMDRDCLIAHGLSYFIHESMMVRGDQYKLAICNKTGCIAIYNESKNLFISPYVDGPLQFKDITNYNANIVHLTKFGRDFSIINIPYAFKLLMQELQTMNCAIRIITEKNVDHIMSLQTGNDLQKAGFKDLDEVMFAIKTELNKEGTVENKSPEILERTPIEITGNSIQIQPWQFNTTYDDSDIRQVDPFNIPGVMSTSYGEELHKIDQWGSFVVGKKVKPKFLEREAPDDRSIIYTIEKIYQDLRTTPSKITVHVSYDDVDGFERKKQYDIDDLEVLDGKTFVDHVFKVGDMVNAFFIDKYGSKVVEGTPYRIKSIKDKSATLEKEITTETGETKWEFAMIRDIEELLLITKNMVGRDTPTPFSPKSPEGVATERDLITVGSTVIYRGKFDDRYIVKDANYNTGQVFIEPKDVREGERLRDPPVWVPIKELQWLLDEDGNTPNNSEASPQYIPQASTSVENETEFVIGDNVEYNGIKYEIEDYDIIKKTVDLVNPTGKEGNSITISSSEVNKIKDKKDDIKITTVIKGDDDDDLQLLKPEKPDETSDEKEEDKKKQSGGTHTIKINTAPF
jgi:DNA-directed RNA polymerase II subunit RPB2